MRYRDFELLIGEKRPDGYHVRVINSPAGQADGILNIDPDTSFVQKALTRLEKRDTDEAFLKNFGGSLFDKLFTGGIRNVFHHSLGQVRTEGTGLRMRLRIEPPTLSSLPWEYLYDPEGNFFLATSPEILISRYIQVSRSLIPLLIDLPLRILLVISGPSDLPQLNVEEEEACIRSALSPLIESQQVELDVLRVATRQRIQSQLQDTEYHVFHFIGHGDFYQDQGYLALVDKGSGKCNLIDAEHFSTLFLGYRPMSLILLNACKTAQTGTEKAFVGMAPHLVGRGIPAVIAMRYSIPDPTAILFSEEFYKPFAKGYPVDTAISEARKAILLDIGRGKRDFGIPVLFMRAEDGVIVEFHSEKREKIVGGTQEALHTISELFEQYALKDGSAALDEMIGNLTELVELNRHLLEWIELHDMLQELDVGFTLICDEVLRKQPFEVDIPSIKAQWRLWKNSTFVKIVTFASSIGYVDEPYYEDNKGQPHGAEWMVELVKVQRKIDEDLEQLSLIPLQNHVSALSNAIRKYIHFARRQLRTTATSLSALSDELLATIKY